MTWNNLTLHDVTSHLIVSYRTVSGSAVLVHTHCDVDKSNSSYYGSSGLFLLSADGSLSASVPQSKEGQIHDVQWSPLGDR